jgi:hypothetical protein
VTSRTLPSDIIAGDNGRAQFLPARDQLDVILSLIDNYHQHLLTKWRACQKQVLHGADAELGVETEEMPRRRFIF